MSGAHVFVHPTQFPEPLQRDLLRSLRSRSIDPKFHYESYQQTAKWLSVHDEHSPARQDPTCVSAYDAAFQFVRDLCPEPIVHVIGLGVGGGQKEGRLLKLLAHEGRELDYTPVDVGLGMVLAARAAVEDIRALRCFPVLCDMLAADDLADTLAEQPVLAERRVVTLFGVVPNAPPDALFTRVASILGPGDLLLVSANMAPGPSYQASVEAILPQYDNARTRDWLMTFLRDLGVGDEVGALEFSIETDAAMRKRIVARFVFHRPCRVRVQREDFSFETGENILLFFSYRHTEATLNALFIKHRLAVKQRWANASAEEAVFLCARQ